MKTLIVEDDFISRKILKEILAPYGELDIAIDGEEAVKAFRMAFDDGVGYDLVCMDIMMPNMDGQESLKQIRSVEKERGVREGDEVKVVMISALGDPKTVVEAFYRGGATSYLVKPIGKQKLLSEIKNFGLIR
jgi:two-component system chemotaxis response regulator CheY